MKQNDKKRAYVQCRNCGKIYYIDEDIPLDRLIVHHICPKCGYDRALNCGDCKENIYLYMDETLDTRFYLY